MTDAAQKSPSVQFIIIGAEQAGQRIDNFLITLEKGVPKSRIYRAVRKGEVRVNKGRIKQTYKLQAGDEVRVPPLRISDKTDTVHVSDSLAQILRQQIIYEDDYLLALNKPEGLAVVKPPSTPARSCGKRCDFILPCLCLDDIASGTVN